MISQLSREIKRCRDCSFLYTHQDILPTAFKNIFNDRTKRLYNFIMPIKYRKSFTLYEIREDDGIGIIKILRKIIFISFKNSFWKNLSQDVENDLLKQVHGTFIEELEESPYSDNNLKTYLNFKKFWFFDTFVDIKRYI